MSALCHRPMADRGAFELEFEARLVEEAVLRALLHRPEERDFHAERDPLYGIGDPEARDEAFRLLHGRWCVRLRLDAPVRRALEEQPAVAATTRGCRIVTAANRQGEGADLAFPASQRAAARPGEAAGRARPLVVVRLRATTLLDVPAALALLRREFLHVGDMLDPGFGYEPELPPSEGGPAFDALFVERYRTLWETSVAGRMLRRGWLGEDSRASVLARFAATFPLLGEELEWEFARWFDRDAHTHRDMAEFARTHGRPTRTTAGEGAGVQGRSVHVTTDDDGARRAPTPWKRAGPGREAG